MKLEDWMKWMDGANECEWGGELSELDGLKFLRIFVANQMRDRLSQLFYFCLIR